MNYKKSRLIPAYKWNQEKYADINLTRVFSIINNNQLNQSTAHHEWGCLADCNDIVEFEENRLPMIQISDSLSGFKVDVANDAYKCRLQINSIIEALPYSIGHFKPYMSDYIIVLTDDCVSTLQVLNDCTENMIKCDPSPLSSTEMVRLAYDPFSWIREEFELNMSA